MPTARRNPQRRTVAECGDPSGNRTAPASDYPQVAAKGRAMFDREIDRPYGVTRE